MIPHCWVSFSRFPEHNESLDLFPCETRFIDVLAFIIFPSNSKSIMNRHNRTTLDRIWPSREMDYYAKSDPLLAFNYKSSNKTMYPRSCSFRFVCPKINTASPTTIHVKRFSFSVGSARFSIALFLSELDTFFFLLFKVTFIKIDSPSNIYLDIQILNPTSLTEINWNFLRTFSDTHVYGHC